MSPPTHFLSGSGKPPPEKSKFLQTCNRLSVFLKENNNLNLGINPKFNATATATGVIETSPAEAARTIDLLSTIDDEKASQPANVPHPHPAPEYVILDSSCEVKNPTNKLGAQMTIFYGGQVVVLDDVPAERAKDVMLMAHKAQPQPQPNQSKSAAAGQGGGEKDSDLPIARRASLHKFLAKRKDRATVRASPYQQGQGASSSGGNDHTFDLNCNPN